MSDDDGPAWVDSKRRPRPAPLSGSSAEVSRSSGLAVATGTFGKSKRFSSKLVEKDNPGLKRNQLFKGPLEQEKSCTLGIGERPAPNAMLSGGPPPSVGPGSYNIVHSAAGPRSPLDGPEFCSATIKVKLPSSLIGLPMPSPGPHARYEVRGDLNRNLPSYAKHKPLLSRNGRHESMEGVGDPGPGHYQDDTYKSVQMNTSCPNLRGAGERCMEATGGTKRCLKSTFGGAPRFSKDKVPNSSPQGDRYYAHSKILDGEEYLKGSRSCTFGACGKTDMANPLKGPRHEVCPHTYYPEGGYSAAGRTSALDGLASRCTSPVHQFSRNLGSTKHAHRGRSCPPGSKSPDASPSFHIDRGSPGGGGAGDS